MSEYKMGFIGVGNMGSALAKAAARSGHNLLLSNRTTARAQQLANELNCDYGSNIDVAKKCHFIFLGVKPQMLPELLYSLRSPLAEREDSFVLVSMAAGVSIQSIRDALDLTCPIIRIMPNLPVSLGSGVILMAPDSIVDSEEIMTLRKLLSAAGLIIRLDEEKIDAASAVSGCGPAYAYMFIEAMIDGAVSCGLTAKQAQTLVAQTMIGSAQMVLRSGKHPGQLRTEVCSPGGTTIAGVRTLEEKGFRAAAMDAVIAAYERTVELARK